MKRINAIKSFLALLVFVGTVVVVSLLELKLEAPTSIVARTFGSNPDSSPYQILGQVDHASVATQRQPQLSEVGTAHRDFSSDVSVPTSFQNPRMNQASVAGRSTQAFNQTEQYYGRTGSADKVIMSTQSSIVAPLATPRHAVNGALIASASTNAQEASTPFAPETPSFAPSATNFGGDPGGDPTGPPLPIGNGIFILTCLAAGYVITKKGRSYNR